MQSYSDTTTTLGAILQQSCQTGDNISATASDYWNIDDILAEEQSVPVEFLMDCKGLAHLDQINNVAATAVQQKAAKNKTKDKVLLAKSKLELPLWIGIAMSQRNIVELKKPPFLTT